MKFNKLSIGLLFFLCGCAIDRPEDLTSKTPAFTKTYPRTNAKDFAFCYALGGNAMTMSKSADDNYRLTMVGYGVGSILAVIYFKGSPTTVEIRENRSISPGWSYNSFVPLIEKCGEKISINP
jgi:hypothetical protein